MFAETPRVFKNQQQKTARAIRKKREIQYFIFLIRTFI